MTSSIICWNCSSTTSMKFCTPRGTSATLREATKASAGQDDHGQPRVGHVVGNARQAEDRRMLDRVHEQLSSRAEARPCTTSATGQHGEPTTSAIGWAQPLAKASGRAGGSAPRPVGGRVAAIHVDGIDEPADDGRPRRAASQRKLPSASAPPASTPAAPGAPPSQPPPSASDRDRGAPSAASRASSDHLTSSAFPLRSLDRSKEVHESCGDPESEADQQQPRATCRATGPA